MLDQDGASTDDVVKWDGTKWAPAPESVKTVNSKDGAVVLDADDIDDAVTTNKFTTAADIIKLAGIETGADVTDETNVVSSLDGATITGVTVDGTDKVLIQDTSDADNIKTVTAQSIADLASGGAITQIVTDISTTFQTISSTSFTALTGISAVITPATASKRILVTVSMLISKNANAETRGQIRIFRNGSQLTGQGSGDTIFLPDVAATSGEIRQIMFAYVDSPASTSAQTYTLEAFTTNASSSYNIRGDSARTLITLEEID